MPRIQLVASLSVLLAFQVVPCLAASPETAETPSVYRVYYEDVGQIRLLHDFDVWEYNNLDERYVLVMIAPGQQADLVATGLPVALDRERTEAINAPRVVSPLQVAGIPGYPCFRTVEETYATAEAIVAAHPTLAAWIDIGDSWEKQNGEGGWDIRVLELTNTAIPGPKPALFVTSSMHAREYAPAELVTRFAEYLVDGYGNDADATWILDHHEVHLMLVPNPDGRKKAETGLSWRKNTNRDYCSPTSNDRGADLNRNAAFEWGCCGGSSGAECSIVYRGPSPASEPETQLMQDYMLGLFPDQRADPLSSPAPADATGVYLDIHSASQLMLWPWGFGGTPPNETPLRTFGRKLADYNGYTPMQAIDLYPTDGTLMDFAYGELGVASIVYEIGTSFFQDCGFFENVMVGDNLPSLVYAAKVARTPYLTPAGPDALGVAALPAVVSLGLPFDLVATLDDTRFNNSNGTEPTQAVVAAEYYVDTPPWTPGAVPAGMLAVDGGFDETIEPVTAVVDSVSLGFGRHTLFVRGQDAAGNWGATSAAFIEIEDDFGDEDGDGVDNASDCRPLDPTAWAPPGDVGDLMLNKQLFGNVAWSAPADPGAQVVGYHVLRSPEASDFDEAICTIVGSGTTMTDQAVPASGAVRHYLVRVQNRCGENMGTDSAGQPRSGASCLP